LATHDCLVTVLSDMQVKDKKIADKLADYQDELESVRNDYKKRIEAEGQVKKKSIESYCIISFYFRVLLLLHLSC